MGLAMFWLLGAVVVGIIASSRGRSAAGWFFLAALLSPVLMGVLVLALGRKPTAQELAPKMKCAFCAEVVLMEARRCKHCGADLSEQHSEMAAAEQAQLQRYAKSNDDIRAMFGRRK